jgi:tetratricopeptide (TPR) repeat protein
MRDQVVYYAFARLAGIDSTRPDATIRTKKEFPVTVSAIRPLLLLSFLLLLSPLPILADDWLDTKNSTELSNLVKEYYVDGRPDSALIIAKRAVAKAKIEFGDLSDPVASCLHAQATLLYSMGEIVPAVPLYEKAHAIWNSVPPADSVLWGASKYNLAVIYIEQRRYPGAVRLLRDALALLDPRMEANDPSLAAVYYDLGEAFRLAKVNDSAVIYYREALNRQQIGLGKYDLQVARTWNNMGLSLAALDKFGEAEEAYNKALTSMERVLGADDLEVGYCIENLVSLYVKLGKNEQAGRLASLALGIFETKLGINSLQALELHYLEGIISHREKDYTKAGAAYRDVHSRLKTLSTRESKQLTLRVLTSLVELYQDTGDKNRADEVQKEIDILDKQLNG